MPETKNSSVITVKMITGTDEELDALRSGQYDFGIIQNVDGASTTIGDPLFSVITQDELPFFAGWKRQQDKEFGNLRHYYVYGTCATKEAILMRLRKFFKRNEVVLIA